MARPTKEIDYKQFEQLMSIGCTEAEICDVLGVTDKTLNKRLREKYGLTYSDMHNRNMFFGKTCASLRRAQIRNALSGNTYMQTWLGKNYLGQKDSRDLTITDARELEDMTDEELDAEIKKLENSSD